VPINMTGDPALIEYYEDHFDDHLSEEMNEPGKNKDCI
jgi:hypothetical protein